MLVKEGNGLVHAMEVAPVDQSDQSSVTRIEIQRDSFTEEHCSSPAVTLQTVLLLKSWRFVVPVSGSQDLA